VVLAVAAVSLAAAAGKVDAAKAAAKGKYRALFNFGDSLADAGNLIAKGAEIPLTTAKLPYGQTYFGKATGRCSDGRLVIDHLAQEFGLSLLPPSKANHSDFNSSSTGPTSPSPARRRSTRPTSRPGASARSSGTPVPS